MDRTDAMAWVVSLCSSCLRKSQAKTLSVLVAATMHAARLSQAEIGRTLAGEIGGIAKHMIKRVYRFIANERVEPVEVMPEMMDRLLRRKLKWHRKHPSRRPLLVSLDWTKVRRFHTLMAAIVIEGRALPLCWESYRDKVQGKSQNALEYAMLTQIKQVLGEGIKIVVLADRGFGRAAFFKECHKQGMDYLVRIKGKVHVHSRVYEGLLEKYPLNKGECRGWHDVSYRADGEAVTQVILRWKRGLKGDKDQPWYLATSLTFKSRSRIRKLSELYALRFDIEELFRDAKNESRGWSLGKTQVKKADRLDRLILIAAVAYLLLMAIGLWCAEHYDPRQWASNNRHKELSAFAIARTMQQRITVKRRQIVQSLSDALENQWQNWG